MKDNFPGVVLKALAWFFVIFFISCESRIPVLTSIEPKIGRMGDVITLHGINFGESREESYITIAGVAPTGSSYYLWQDDLIMVRVPEMGESGLIYVHSGGRKSNGALFTNSASVPRPIEGEELGLGPRISSINPQTGAPGTLITITGNNFGGSKEGGGVFFSWDYASQLNRHLANEPEYIEASETELGYVSWNAREIKVRLPDGAISGNIEVRTPHGSSRPVYFDVTGKPGLKKFTEKRSYTINYSVDIRVLEATRPNNLYLWIPIPVNSPSQRNVNLLSRNTNPFVENHKGISLFKLENMVTGTNQLINHSFSVDVYTVETEINSQAVRNDISPLSVLYTQSTNLIPGSQQIKEITNTVIGREQNPYNKSKMIYDWITTNMQLVENLPSTSDNISMVLETMISDPYTIAVLYTAMSRAAGVPCIPVAGVLVDRNQQTSRHYWAEFWLDNFGWVPVDPVMGIRTQNESINYFGNIDNHRIAFSRGELILSQMESRGRLLSGTQSYSMQNIREEASGGLDSYTSLWGDIIIDGIYIQ